MSNTATFPKSTVGKHFFVSGLTGGREVFLGKAVDEPFEDHLTLEGKVLSMRPRNRVVVRPFHTTVNFPLSDPNYAVQHISDPRAHEEAQNLLSLPATHVSRSTSPYVHKWVSEAMRHPDEAAFASATHLVPRAVPRQISRDPFIGFYEGFQTTAEEFRRSLFQTRALDSTRELDRITELEGDLLIEIGKVTNQAAMKLNQILAREKELAQYFEAFQGGELPLGNARLTMSGWPYLFERLQQAKKWGRRRGKGTLVRDINAILKDSVFALNEVILDHINSLDTLITETFGQYGLSRELEDEVEPVSVFEPGMSAETLHPARLPS